MLECLDDYIASRSSYESLSMESKSKSLEIRMCVPDYSWVI